MRLNSFWDLIFEWRIAEVISDLGRWFIKSNGLRTRRFLRRLLGTFFDTNG